MGQELTESDILLVSRQYDIELVYEARLSGLGLGALDRRQPFARCCTLAVLDVSRNKLATLCGLAELRGTLCVLNAAENQLTDISDVAACMQLQRVFLEGNMLKSVAELQPLTALPHLVELCLRRSVNVDGVELLLDNPVCADPAAYHALAARLPPSLRWLDGVHYYSAAADDAESGGKGTGTASAPRYDDEGTKNAEAEAVVGRVTDALQAMQKETSTTEHALRQLLTSCRQLGRIDE